MMQQQGDTAERQEFYMNIEANRYATFADWPFDGADGAQCTSDKMAEAGFYHMGGNNEPDLVKCFMCAKELDGWEPHDDPMSEHKSHAPKCAFVNAKPEGEQTMEEFLKLEAIRQCSRFMKHVDVQIGELAKQMEATREKMEIM